ncbi:glutamine--fructose-6-phosphate transaminase (isomerizing) [Pyruvatibacter sp.]|uniref:glutamine--fructose-6-phosphate transaminase (isomerizing) n=1 Tax=Pyruvatibacter sp. TaxID=1981328 RepID=UPI003264718F
MCGIVGVIGKSDVAPVILESLRRLEYRGYDSAGIATLVDGAIDRRRATGKLNALSGELDASPLNGTIGIGHTRWATHGAPTQNNAHPHATENVAVVHNGIIENFRDLRQELEAAGATFSSDTDTEVIAHLINGYLADGKTPKDAVEATLSRLEGAFALAIVFKGENKLMIGARQGSPLAVGYGDGEMYLGSDAFALAPMTNRVAYLEDGDWVVITDTSAVVYNADGREVSRPVQVVPVSAALVDKGNHRHFMAKEIHEQPEVAGHVLGHYVDPYTQTTRVPDLPFDLADIPKITIVACGTAYYAAVVAKYWFEQLARVPVEVDVASEFRYREGAMTPGGLALFISQSGETADTLAALRYCRENGQHIASIVNVTESTIARESDHIFPTLAGPEIGVASTKAFVCQLMVLAVLAIATAYRRGKIDDAEHARLTSELTAMPRHLSDVLRLEPQIEKLSYELSNARDVLYLGRGVSFPLALEGALKLKEISYIHAEGYPAGELKHGPIALIDDTLPVIVIAPWDKLFEKTVSNMQEVMARGGRIILLSDKRGIDIAGDEASALLQMPDVDPFTAPILYAVPLQLIAYHTAVHKGTDVDQPRNLAKSVTVE